MNQPPPISPTASYFEILSVPVSADEATLTRRFHELSRLYHPDRWGTADIATQTTVLESAALINDAYRTLRDPFTRAEYLLRRERGTRPDDLKQSAKPPQELFAEVLELQELLMEFQEAQADDDAETAERLRPQLEEARKTFEQAYTEMADRLNAQFERWDAGEDRAAVLDAMSEVIGIRGYLRRVLTNLQNMLG
ncbi:MAG: co-chaperone HscB [Armatimonadaceae bacterium]